jgi:rubrerythrin
VNLVPLIRWVNHGIGTVSGAVQRWKKVKTMRLINADALYKDICRAYDECGDILEIIDKQQTIEPRKKGKWVKQNPMVDTEECSECGYNIQGEELETPFCPWCGADMRCEHDG